MRQDGPLEAAPPVVLPEEAVSHLAQHRGGSVSAMVTPPEPGRAGHRRSTLYGSTWIDFCGPVGTCPLSTSLRVITCSPGVILGSM